MVPGRDERVREPREQAAAVVADRRGLAVHLRLRARDGGAERLPDRLVAEADAEDRRGRAEAPDHLEGDPRLVGVAGTRRDDNALGCPREDAREVNGVVAQHLEPGAELAQVLDEVVGEGVVVVDDQDHRPGLPAAIRSASSIPWAFERVSSHSVFGSESATIPAPTCTEARVPSQTTVRIVMHESRVPEDETEPTAPPQGPPRGGSSSSM